MINVELAYFIIVTAVAAVALRRLNHSVTAYMLQGVIMSTIFIMIGFWPLAAITLITKVIVTPALLFFAIKSTVNRETPPSFGGIGSILFMVAGIVGLFVTLSGVLSIEFIVAISLFFLGFYVLTARRDLIKNVIGFLFLENGVLLTLVFLAPHLPETIEIGIAADAIITVVVLLYVITGIHKKLQTTDTKSLVELKW
ncbi:MAG: NADH-quinone oxidoreductase subunit K [Candidatus Bathyarchaeota archaeon]